MLYVPIVSSFISTQFFILKLDDWFGVLSKKCIFFDVPLEDYSSRKWKKKKQKHKNITQPIKKKVKKKNARVLSKSLLRWENYADIRNKKYVRYRERKEERTREKPSL